MKATGVNHKDPPNHILTPLALTIRRIVPPSPCIVGAGEGVDVGMGPLHPVRGTGIAARRAIPLFEMYWPLNPVWAAAAGGR